ncbi:DUF6689 family protein [Thermomonas sp.]
MKNVSKILLLVLVLMCPSLAAAQSLPVQVTVQGNTAVARIGNAASPIAEVILDFEDASGLTASSVGITAKLVSAVDASLLARLPAGGLAQVPASQPLLITIEPPVLGGLSFRGTGRFELHTHALPYAIGSSFRVFKAPLNGAFRDTTEEIAEGSVRARSRYDGFSQFLVVADMRPTDAVVVEKISFLRGRVAALPVAERAGFNALLDALETSVADHQPNAAIALANDIAARARSRAAAGAIGNEWRATRDVINEAGGLIAGSSTLKFSLAYLRDFGL